MNGVHDLAEQLISAPSVLVTFLNPSPKHSCLFFLRVNVTYLTTEWANAGGRMGKGGESRFPPPPILCFFDYWRRFRWSPLPKERGMTLVVWICEYAFTVSSWTWMMCDTQSDPENIKGKRTVKSLWRAGDFLLCPYCRVLYKLWPYDLGTFGLAWSQKVTLATHTAL